MDVVGIDLGSQTSRSRASSDGKVSEHSCASVIAQTSDRLLVGKPALRELDTRHNNCLRHFTAGLCGKKRYELRCKSHSRKVSPELGIALIIEKIRKGGSKACIPVHTCMTAAEQQNLRCASIAGGCPDVTFLPSTLAASIHCTQLPPSALCLVVDVGCRFTSTSVVRTAAHFDAFPELIKSAGLRMGGHDIDRMFANHLSLSPGPESEGGCGSTHVVLYGAIEKAKKDLSSLRDTVVSLPGVRQSVSRAELEGAAEGFFSRLEEVILEVTEGQEVTCAVLVGGAGRMPRVKDMVSSAGGRPGVNCPLQVADYDFAAVEGAVRWLRLMQIRDREPPPALLPFRYYTSAQMPKKQPAQLFSSSLKGADLADTLPKNARWIIQTAAEGKPPTAEVFTKNCAFVSKN